MISSWNGRPRIPGSPGSSQICSGKCCSLVQPEEFLLRQGDAPSSFYGLVQGAIKVSILGEDRKEAILTVFEVGNWFGETSLLDGLPRMHDMSAVTGLEVRCIDPGDFDRLMRNNAALDALHTWPMATPRYR